MMCFIRVCIHVYLCCDVCLLMHKHNTRTHTRTLLSTTTTRKTLNHTHTSKHNPQNNTPNTHKPPGAIIVEDDPSTLPMELQQARDLVCMLQHVNVASGTFRNYAYAAERVFKSGLRPDVVYQYEDAPGKKIIIIINVSCMYMDGGMYFCMCVYVYVYIFMYVWLCVM